MGKIHWKEYSLALSMPDKADFKEGIITRDKGTIHNDIKINSTGKYNDPKCECTSSNMTSKCIKKNVTELKVGIDQQS